MIELLQEDKVSGTKVGINSKFKSVRIIDGKYCKIVIVDIWGNG